MISVREFAEDLKKQGYSVGFNAQIKGTSGQVHHVDGIAKRHGKNTIVWLEESGNSITGIIKTFAIAYDTGADACYVVDEELGEEERKLAEFYKIRLLSKG